MAAGVYWITCTRNGRQYIGSSTDTHVRRRAHRRDLKKGVHHCADLQSDWDTYGPNAFTFTAERHDADYREAEQRAIVEARRAGIDLYNARDARLVGVTTDEEFLKALDTL